MGSNLFADILFYYFSSFSYLVQLGLVSVSKVRFSVRVSVDVNHNQRIIDIQCLRHLFPTLVFRCGRYHTAKLGKQQTISFLY